MTGRERLEQLKHETGYYKRVQWARLETWRLEAHFKGEFTGFEIYIGPADLKLSYKGQDMRLPLDVETLSDAKRFVERIVEL